MSDKYQIYQDLTLLSALRRRAEEEPSRTWVSQPLDNHDITKKFHHISFRQLAIAVDHATVWLNKVLDDAKNSVFAYQGYNDCTPPILALAAARLGSQILLPFPLVSSEMKRYLIQAADCKILLYPDSYDPKIKQMLLAYEQLNIKTIAVPNFLDSLYANESPSVTELPNSFEQITNRPWLTFHSSGTTGKPKLVTYTQEMITAGKLQALATAPGRETNLTLIRDSVTYLMIPSVHLSGMFIILAGAIFFGMNIVLGPTDRPPSSEIVKHVLRFSGAKGFMTPPIWIRQLCNDPEGLALLKDLDSIAFVGAPMDKHTGDSLCQYTQLAPAIGSTECGPYWTYVIKEPHDWEYYSFLDGQGIEFEKVSENLYELVFRKSKEAIWQQIFLQKPDLDVYYTADLFKKHPTRPDLWFYVGRKDDMFKLSSGHKMHYTMNERLIEESALVKTAIVGGPGVPVPFLLVEPAAYPESEDAEKSLLAGIWEVVDRFNQQDNASVAISKDMIILADRAKPFSRTAKDSVSRHETFELYAREIQERMAARNLS